MSEKELHDLCCALFRLLDRTAQMLEEESPALAEIGYWSAEEKAVYETAKTLCEDKPSPRIRGYENRRDPA
jgi:hypothetical protein